MSWIEDALGEGRFIPPDDPNLRNIAAAVKRTKALGQLPLWEGYGKTNVTRTPAQVSAASEMGSFYSWLVRERHPELVVEFGTAFGVSGMYWLSGIEHNGHGELLTFEPNELWHKVAVENLRQIGHRFRAIHGCFEDRVATELNGQEIDIALIDAIHKKEFVLPQFDLVCERLRPGGLVIFDDIRFSEDMFSAWRLVASDCRVACCVELGGIGIVEKHSLNSLP